MASTIATEKSTAVAPPKLVVYRRDPFAWLVFRAFGRHPALFFGLMVLVGVVSLYVIPATNGTLEPRPGFLSALSDLNSAIIWLLLIPAAAVAYVGQLHRIPELFDRLQANGVTGLTDQEYRAFLDVSSRHYNRGMWSVIALLGFAPLWALFLIAVSRSPYTWYYPPNLWPWLLYVSIQYLEIYAAISYGIRYFITTRRLRKLLHQGQLCPQLLHPDGVAGFGPVITFVQGSLQIAGGVLLVVALESINTARSVTQFSHGSGVAAFIVVALVYVTIVPYLLLDPLRTALRGIRHAKRSLLHAVSRQENRVLWQHIIHLQSHAGSEADEDVAAVARSVKTLSDLRQASDLLPDSLLELGFRRSQTIFLSSVVPPAIGVILQLLSINAVWNGLLSWFSTQFH